MAKYSYEFKQKVVSEYLKGDIEYKKLAKKHSIPSHETVRQWDSTFTCIGSKSLKWSRNKTNFTFAYKLRIVESYLTSEMSYQELALTQNIYNSSLIARLVSDFKKIGKVPPNRKKGICWFSRPVANT